MMDNAIEGFAIEGDAIEGAAPEGLLTDADLHVLLHDIIGGIAHMALGGDRDMTVFVGDGEKECTAANTGL